MHRQIICIKYCKNNADFIGIIELANSLADFIHQLKQVVFNQEFASKINKTYSETAKGGYLYG